MIPMIPTIPMCLFFRAGSISTCDSVPDWGGWSRYIPSSRWFISEPTKYHEVVISKSRRSDPSSTYRYPTPCICNNNKFIESRVQARLFLLTTLTFTFYHITSINSYKPKLFPSYKHNYWASNRQYIITSIFINEACLSVSNRVLEVYIVFIQKWN